MTEITENIKTEIAIIQDAEKVTRNAQVQFVEKEDVQIIEQYRISGVDCVPPVGTKHLTIDLGGGWKISFAENDGVEPDSTLEEGETKLYSSDNGTVKASLILRKDGKVALGNGTNELLDLMDQMLTEMITLVDSTVLGGSNPVDAPGAASQGTLNIIAPALLTMKGKLDTIQTKLGIIKE